MKKLYLTLSVCLNLFLAVVMVLSWANTERAIRAANSALDSAEKSRQQTLAYQKLFRECRGIEP